MSALTKVGGWLFVNRGWLPVPVLGVVIALAHPPHMGWISGLLFIAVGMAIRLWGVAHLGSRGRTRARAVGGLVQSGPYRYSRNPLYVGNLIIYFGVLLMAGRPVVLGLVLVGMCVHYRLIVHWEEWRLSKELGDVYRVYCGRVCRWAGGRGATSTHTHTWISAIKSERATWIAIGVVVVALVCQGVVQMP